MKNNLAFKQLFFLTFAAFGIQFGSALQMANISSIYKYLGANVDNLALLWLAAPVTGLLVQPIIGYMSDKTWCPFWIKRFGRRQPYILFWALCALVSLILMPNSTSLFMAAALLWLMDSANNGATEPFRAMIGDKTPKNQMNKAFALQTIFASAGATLAALLPFLMQHLLHLNSHSNSNGVPLSIKLAFYIGGAAFFLAVLITTITTKEDPPADMTAWLKTKQQKHAFFLIVFWRGLKEIVKDLIHMPKVIKEFYPVQLFNWMGMFCMWLFFGIGIAQNVYGLPPGAHVAGSSTFSGLLEKGAIWCGICFATYQFVSLIYAFFLPTIAKKIGAKGTHGVSLLFGSLGLMSAMYIHNDYLLILCMIGVGITWGSIMTMPYAIISAAIPTETLGVYMGLFNITITIPQIICALVLGIVSRIVFHNHAMKVVFTGGILLLIAGLLMIRLQLKDNKKIN